MKKRAEKNITSLSSKNCSKKTSSKLSKCKDISQMNIEDLLVSLEEEFHKDFIPRDIIMKVLKLTCDYYGGDWCGAVDVQTKIDLWAPRWWFNQKLNGMLPEELTYCEKLSDYPDWSDALKNENILIFRNLNQIEILNPDEANSYRKLNAESVIAAPYYKGDTGFLIVRNPSQNVENTNLIKLMSYIISSEMNEYRMIERTKHQIHGDGINNKKDVVINLFGRFEIITQTGIAESEAIQGTQIAQIICFLCVNRGHAKNTRSIADSINDDSAQAEIFANKIKYYIYHFRQDYRDLFPAGELIRTNKYGYQLNQELHIVTDLDCFDHLYEVANKITDPEEKIIVLEKIMNLYKGDIFPPCSLEQWLMPVTMKYNALYLRAAEQLFKLLDKRQEYTAMHEYAAVGLRHESNNEKFYYWLIVSMIQKNAFNIAMKEYKISESKLDPLSYQTLTRHLNARYGAFNKMIL